MPGIGKTALANLAGYALLKGYPDAQLFIELGANSPSPLSPLQALTQCLRAFDPQAKLPDDEPSLRSLYLSALQGKRALVILDDARDDAHVAPLLPPPGCAAIITSRHALRTGTPLPLDVLPRTESIKLLRSFTNRVNDCADALAVLCGDLPIALGIAGGYLKNHESKPVQEYVQALQSARRLQHLQNEEKQLEVFFDYSYRTLIPSEQAAFQSLAVMPADFDRPAALAVIGSDDAGADDLDELVSLNLLQYDTQAARFRWHDLLRDFARSRAALQALDAAADRHSAHFVTALSQADDLYLAGNASIVRGLALYDQEAVHIQVGQAWAAAHASEKVAAQRCLDYADAGVYVLSLRLHHRERIRWLEAQLAAARKLHRREYEGIALGNLGNAYARLGDARKAIDFYEQALVIAREIGDRRGEGAALGNLGLAYYSLGDARKAIEYHEQALVIDREIGDRRGEGADLGNLGLAYARLGDARKAIEYHEQALVIDREIGDRRGEGATLGNLGNAYAALGDARKAIDFYEQQLRITREIGDRQGEAVGLDNLGNAYVALCDTHQAIELCGQSLLILRQIGDRYNEAIASWDLGLAYKKQEDFARAIPLMKARVDYEREIGDPDAEKHAKQVEELHAKLAAKDNE
jgi:tetratricopeptide (TPR) repeat protein